MVKSPLRIARTRAAKGQTQLAAFCEISRRFPNWWNRTEHRAMLIRMLAGIFAREARG